MRLPSSINPALCKLQKFFLFDSITTKLKHLEMPKEPQLAVKEAHKLQNFWANREISEFCLQLFPLVDNFRPARVQIESEFLCKIEFRSRLGVKINVCSVGGCK
jgi:hypothetical protein